MSVKTQNLAIIFTDIVGYTEATHQKSRQQNENLVKNHNKILYPLIRKFKGRLVKTIGDALLITFSSPTDAMLSAMAMQDALHEFNQTVSPAEQIHIRIAASLGEVRVVRNDIFGEAVNVTSRIESITPADEIYLSEAVYLAMNKAEVPAQEVGYRELKGIPNQIKIFTIPRFSVPRLVPEQVGTISQKLNYPFGGMHLIANSSPGVLKSLPELPVSISQMFRQPWTWPAAAIAAVALAFYGVLSIWSPDAQQKVASNNSQTASNAAQSIAPILERQKNPEPYKDPTPNLIDEIASGSRFMRNLTQIEPKPQVKENIVPAENAVATPNAPNQVAALQPQNIPQQNTLPQNVKPAQVSPKQPEVRSQVPPPVPVRKQAPAQYTSFSRAKQAYREGRMTKENYKNVIRGLDEQRDAELRRVKDLYRTGKILRTEYEQRYTAVKRKYE